jgi:hypothetical protein
MKMEPMESCETSASNTQTPGNPPAYEDGTDRVPKRRLVIHRRRGFTQKKIYYISKFH